MARPKDIKVIDLMLGIPMSDDMSGTYEFLKPLLLDKESQQMFKMPAQYMFKDIPELEKREDYVAYTVEQMDKHNIEIALTDFLQEEAVSSNSYEGYAERFAFAYSANPNNGMNEVHKIRELHKKYGIKAISAFPCGLNPQVPINDKKWYPIYTTCMDLDIPFACCVGVPGPRLPMAAQKVELIDEVCWFFPELKFVMRHGGEPWTDLAVKLMIKYPNLYYSTSAFAPKHYPKSIIDYANTRGADKIMYAGYYPMGLSLDRIFKEFDDVPFKDDVWPKFLRENAKRVFQL